MIDIVDVGTGNIASLEFALKKLNIRYKLCSRVADFKNKKIIIPGVGAFNDFIKKLRIKKIDKYIIDSSIQNTPILGICLGFQVLFSSSTEHQKTHGLNILQGDFNIIKPNKVVPHVGWNSCEITKEKDPLFNGIANSSDFYFTHSYILKKCKKEHRVAVTNYGEKFVSVVRKNNICGVQFHPEKSQHKGLQLLKNFYENFKC